MLWLTPPCPYYCKIMPQVGLLCFVALIPDFIMNYLFTTLPRVELAAGLDFVKFLAMIGLIFFALLTTGYAAPHEIARSHCASIWGANSEQEVKDRLLAQLKQQAVDELWRTHTQLPGKAPHDLFPDTIRIRNVQYKPHPQKLGETCIQASFSIAQQDLADWMPKPVESSKCFDLNQRLTPEQMNRQFKLDMLHEYNSGLTTIGEAYKLPLIRNFTEGDVQPKTGYYCATARGKLVPIEVTLILQGHEYKPQPTDKQNGPAPPPPPPPHPQFDCGEIEELISIGTMMGTPPSAEQQAYWDEHC